MLGHLVGITYDVTITVPSSGSYAALLPLYHLTRLCYRSEPCLPAAHLPINTPPHAHMQRSMHVTATRHGNIA